MAVISQTTLSSAFSWKKMSEFRLKFHWSLFLRVQLTILQHWFREWRGAGQATSHYLNQWWLVYWRIYASLGLNELIQHEVRKNTSKSILLLIFQNASRMPIIYNGSNFWEFTANTEIGLEGIAVIMRKRIKLSPVLYQDRILSYVTWKDVVARAPSSHMV